MTCPIGAGRLDLDAAIQVVIRFAARGSIERSFAQISVAVERVSVAKAR